MTVTRRIALMFAAAALSGLGAAAYAAEPVYREFIQGNEKAKVMVIEYASLTCPHCKAFHTDVYPQLKKNYIDTKKIGFVYRDFPLDGLAMGAALLARCAPGDNGMVMVDLLFKNQDAWVRTDDPLKVLRGYAAQAGMNDAAVDACLKNEAVLTKINEVRETGTNLYHVPGTPALYINNTMLEGAPSYENLAAAIDKAIAAAK
jgi:protein-disulfide isomerase